MKKKFLAMLISIITITILGQSAYAFSFSGIASLFKKNANTEVSNMAGKTTASGILDTIAQLNSQMADTDANVQNSFLNLVSLLSSKEESQTVQSKISQIMNNSSINQTEKSTAVSQLLNTYASNLATDKQTVLSNIGKLSAVDKVTLSDAIVSLYQSQCKYLNIATDYTKAAANLAKTSQNVSTLADNLKMIKETADALRANAQAVGSVVLQAASLAKMGGLFVGI